MTQLEQIQAACDALKAKMGAKAVVQVTIGASERHQVFCRPNGWQGDWSIIEYGDPLEALAKAEARLDERAAEMAEKTVKALALAIIRITHEFGACTDAQLRGDFEARDVETLGGQVVELANTMAERGPFEIVLAGEANVGAA